ncbi:putative S-adenosylmethionine:tRNA ribosyltransferase-isomerase [Pillotina sp. SPG140]|jgi:S-adenosylmethionine:tRNA ribosyltransferase-isomerase
MNRNEFFFDLPPHLIAQTPSAQRGNSRLMVINRHSADSFDRYISDLPDLLAPDSLLVFNTSKVRKARIIGTSDGGIDSEFLLIKPVDPYQWNILVSRSKKHKTGSRYHFPDNTSAVLSGNSTRTLTFDRVIDDDWLERYGHIPLPPYIKRADTPEDTERYQTVYAQEIGSVAAPTAGLHITHALLDTFKTRGIDTAFLSLHVGLGTFIPVRTECIEDHSMHEESFTIDETNALKIEQAKAENRPIIAVGTTVVRALESAWDGLHLTCGAQKTAIFIYPGYQFRIIDSLFTNFHTPQSTLFMLVCAFAGTAYMHERYADAMHKGYHFFSYGDAMLIL